MERHQHLLSEYQQILTLSEQMLCWLLWKTGMRWLIWK